MILINPTPPKPRRRQAHHEHGLQSAVVDYLRVALPDRALISGIDHATRSEAEGQQKKRRGIIAGLPDVIVILDGKFYGIELKYGTNKPTVEQKIVGRKIQTNGFCWSVCRSLDDVEKWLRSHAVPLRATALPSGAIVTKEFV